MIRSASRRDDDTHKYQANNGDDFDRAKPELHLSVDTSTTKVDDQLVFDC